MDAAARPPRSVWVALGAGMAILGFAPILVRWAGDAPALALSAWRTVMAVAILAPWAWPRASVELRSMPRRDVVFMLTAGAVLGLHFAAWTASLAFTSVASASVLVTSSPIFLAVLGRVVLGERLRRRTVVAVGVGVAGAMLIGLGDAAGGVFPRAALGNALALGAALLVAIYLLIGRAVRQRATLAAYLLPVYASAAVTSLVVVAATGTSMIQPLPVLIAALGLALGPQLVAHGAFNYAVRFVPAAVIGIATLAEPVVGTLLALALFGEVPSSVAFAGMALVLGALIVTFARRRE